MLARTRSLPALEWAPWPHYAEDEIEAATRILESGKVNYWTGTEGRAFEHEYAAHLGRNHAIALANGTVALELALLAAGVGAGDEVITTSRTFIASASSIVMRGATPVLTDVDRDSGNVTAATIAVAMSPRTKAIILVHLGGWPCEMDPILALAREHGVTIIEDCAQAHGAMYKGRPVGALGDLAAFSFCQDKIISTAGEGGLVAMDETAMWHRAWSYKDHGKDHDAVERSDHPPGFRWVHGSFGTNWRLTEVQAAIGRRQLGKLAHWVDLRNRNAAVMRHHLEELDALRVPSPPPELKHAYYKFYAYVRPKALKKTWSRDRLIQAYNDEGILCRVGSCSEIYRERAFTDAGLGLSAPLPVAAELSDTAVSFEVYPTLGTDFLQEVGERIRTITRSATR